MHSYHLTVALAEQRRSQLEAEAARRRLVQEARRARRAGARRPIRQHLHARALDGLTRLGVRLSNLRGRTATDNEPALRADPTEDGVDLTVTVPAVVDLAELVDARSDGHARASRCA